MRHLPLIAIILAALFLKFNIITYAESLSVSLRVGDTRISFDGYSSPNAFITVTQNSAVIGTTVADASGFFSKMIDADNPGIQTFELFSTDSSSRLTPTLTYNVNLSANTLTSISNIIFPPTISSDSTTNNISGMTSPQASLSLLVSDGSNVTIPVGNDGTWSYIASSAIAGDYTAYVISTMPGNYISLASNVISFTITPSSSATPTPSTPASSVSPSPATTSPSSDPSQVPISSTKPRSTLKTAPTPSPITTAIEPNIISNLVTIARSAINARTILLTMVLLGLIRFTFFMFNSHYKTKKSRSKRSK